MKLDTARVFERIFEIYRDQAAVILTAALIVFVPVALLTGLLIKSGGVGLALVTIVISFVATFWFQGVVVEAVRDIQDGRRDFSVGQLFRSVQPVLGALMGAGVLAGLGIALGLILLIVPGLILLTWWCLMVPVIVLEGKYVGEAFSRSRELVRGHAWTVFGVVIIAAILSGIAAGIIQAIFSFFGPFLRVWIGGTISSAIVGPFVAVALTLMYFTLRDLKAAPAAADPVAPAPVTAAPSDPAQQ